MDNKSDKQAELEDHSLPGTNQAGKGPGAREDGNEDQKPADETPEEKPLYEHSLPGTNQAGKS